MRLPDPRRTAIALVALAVPGAMWLPAFAGPPEKAPTADHQGSATQADVDRAARDFRIQVYRTFRRNRAEFDFRSSTWRNIESQWRKAGARAEELPALVDWLHQATAASRQNAVASLPAYSRAAVARTDGGLRLPAAGNPRQARSSPRDAVGRGIAAPPPIRRADALPLPAVPLVPSGSVAQRDRPVRPESTLAEGRLPRGRPAAAAEIGDLAGIALPEEKAPDAAGGIDVHEVAVRVAGHNLALATLVEEVRRAREPSRDELIAFVERLATLATRAEDLALYFPLVSDSDRARLGKLTTLNTAFGEMSALLERSQATTPAEQAALELRLKELQTRLGKALETR